jgi:hypothetical protein
MKIKLEKPVIWLINLCLSGFFAFGLLILLEQLGYRGWEWYSRSLRAWPILLFYIAGTAVHKHGSLRKLILPPVCLFAGIIIYLIFPFHAPFDIVYIILALIIGAGLYLIGLRGNEAFPSRVAVASIIIYIATLLYFNIRNYSAADYSPVVWSALAAFLLSLYSLNTAGLMSGVHNVKGGEVMAMPSGIRGKNLLLLSLFIIVAVLIGNLDILHRFLQGVTQWLLRGIATFLLFISSLDSGGTAAAPTPSPSPTEKSDLTLPAGDPGNPTFVIIYISIMLALGIALVAFLIFGISRDARVGKSGRLAGFLRRLFKSRQVLEYEDSIERTLDLKGIIKSRGAVLRKLLSKLAYRPERFEDMPDNRMKVRFAYKMLIKSSRVREWIPSATPGEVGSVLRTESLKSLTEHYNSARYDERCEVTREAAENARRALDDMRGRSKNG